MKTINDRIEHIRVMLGYPMRPFARKIGSSSSAVENVLGEKRDDPSMRMIKNILKIFPVNEKWLYVGEGKPFTTDSLAQYKYKDTAGHDIDVGIISRVRGLREHLALSQALFASEIGMSRDALAFMETNRSALQINALKAIVTKFGVNCEWLLFGEGQMLRRKK